MLALNPLRASAGAGDRWQAALEAAVELAASGDASFVLADESGAVVERLLTRLPGVERNLAVLSAVGWWHWHRSIATESKRDHLAAAMFLHPVHQVGLAVPDNLRELFDSTTMQDFPLWAYLGAFLLERATDVDDVKEAARLLMLGAEAAPDDYDQLASLCANLAAALRELYRDVREPELLSDAVRWQRKALSSLPASHSLVPRLKIGLAELLEETARG